MSWRERMGRGSFRGAGFYLGNWERTGGRRGVTHEYPLRDQGFREDLGRSTRSFSVEGYVVGDDYLAARDALLDALEKSGPGEFVHPAYGTRRVAVTNFRVRESNTDRAGWAQFSIEFEETSAEPVQPTAAPDVQGKLRSTVAAARDSVIAEFLATYSPGVHLESIGDALRSATLAVNNMLETVSMEEQAVALLRSRVTAFTAAASSLASRPSDLVAGLVEMISGLTAGDPLGLYDFEPGPRPPGTTTNRRREQANFDALRRLVQRLAVVQAAALAIDATWDNYEAAVARRDAIAERLDDQAETAADDAYPTLLQLRADLVKAVPGDGQGLQHLVEHTPVATVPSLVLAHQLYGDVEREADIVTRNRVSHPGFVVGGTPLEVLSRG